jgi:hypothetical protein
MINNVKKDISIYEWLPKVVEKILEDRSRTKEDISDLLKIDLGRHLSSR